MFTNISEGVLPLQCVHHSHKEFIFEKNKKYTEDKGLFFAHTPIQSCLVKALCDPKQYFIFFFIYSNTDTRQRYVSSLSLNITCWNEN